MKLGKHAVLTWCFHMATYSKSELRNILESVVTKMMRAYSINMLGWSPRAT